MSFTFWKDISIREHHRTCILITYIMERAPMISLHELTIGAPPYRSLKWPRYLVNNEAITKKE